MDFIKRGHNVMGDCVAGSGKTTSVLLLAMAEPHKQFLLLTYNKALKLEVRQKVLAMGLANVEIHTYNSLCVKYYDTEAYNNDKLRAVLTRDAAPSRALPRFDVLVLDETQDMTFLFYHLVKKFKKDAPIGDAHQMVILGDKYQAIYGFMGSDARFISFSNEIWSRPFIPLTLSTSYRVTNEIAGFVNKVMVGNHRVKAVRDGPTVKYVICNPYTVAEQLAEMIGVFLSRGATAGDIFVLAPSIKGAKSPVRRLENILVMKGIHCYYPVSDDAELDEEVIDKKVVFSTFHQSKGRERKIVILYNFDTSYFTYFYRNKDPLVCPEPMYVAATRASEHLILLQNAEEKPLAFLKHSVSQMETDLCDIVTVKWLAEPKFPKFMGGRAAATVAAADGYSTSPTDLTAYLKEHAIHLLTILCAELYSEERPPTYKVEIPSKVTFDDGMCECVSDLNGIAIPAIFEAKLCGESTIEQRVRDKYESMRTTHPFLSEAYRRLGTELRTTSDYLYMTIMFVSFAEEIYNKIRQIKHHDWLTDAMVADCFKVLEHYIQKETVFEWPVEHETHAFPEYGAVLLRGRIDAVDTDTVFEIKCVDTLLLEHKLQLLAYAYMWKAQYEEEYGPRDFKLINIRTGEVLVLNADSLLLTEAMSIMLYNKYGGGDVLDDAAFVARCHGSLDSGCAVRKSTGPLFIEEE